MRKELTLGDLIAFIVVIVGWAISIEVRQAVANTKIETLSDMSQKLNEIHEKVIRLDERQNADLPQVVTRGGVIVNKKQKKYN